MTPKYRAAPATADELITAAHVLTGRPGMHTAVNYLLNKAAMLKRTEELRKELING